MQQVTDEVHIAHRQRVQQTVLLPETVQLLLGRVGALEERDRRIVVGEPHHQEDERDDAEQQRNQQQQAGEPAF